MTVTAHGNLLIPSSGGSRERRERQSRSLHLEVARILAIHAPDDDLSEEEKRTIHSFLAIKGVPTDHPARRFRV